MGIASAAHLHNRGGMLTAAKRRFHHACQSCWGVFVSLMRCEGAAAGRHASLAPHGQRVARTIRRVSLRPQAQRQQPHASADTPQSQPRLQQRPVRIAPPPSPPLPPPPAAAQRRPRTPMQRGGGRKLTLAVVGDVHSQWGADDEAALAWLDADVAIFVGDFGEENVPLIQRIAALPQPKAVLLGNHDAWFSLTPGGRRRHTRAMLASSSMAVRKEWSEGGSTPAIQAQLQALGGDHIGYAAKRWPELGLTMLGGRPFSKGGNRWSDVADFYAEHYGIGSMQDSALQVLDLALAAHRDDCKVLVAHNGPAGLGARRHSICGVDWTSPEADFGDPDLQEALDMMHSQGLHMPLVLFGHMHSQLAGGGSRDMVEVDAGRGTVYINTAVVPRIRSFPAPAGSGGGSNGGGSGGTEAGRTGSTMQGHHFVLVELSGHIVTAARDVWVGVQHTAQTGSGLGGSSSNGSGGGAGSTHCVVLHEQQLLRTAFPPPNTGPALPQQGAEGNGGTSPQTAAAAAAAGSGSEPGSSGGYVCSIYRAHTGEWEPVAVQGAALGSQAAAV